LIAVQNVEVVDGLFIGLNIVKKSESGGSSLRHCNHSWLRTADGAIIDIYPVGFITMAPVLVATKGEMSVFSNSMYIEEPEITREVVNRDLYRNVRVIQKHLKESVKITKSRFKK